MNSRDVIESIVYGTLMAPTIVRVRIKKTNLHDVLQAPNLRYNLISFSQSKQNGFKVIIDEETENLGHGIVELWHKLSGEVKMVGAEPYEGLYEAIGKVDGEETNVILFESTPEWNKRLGHASQDILKATAPHVVGMKETDIKLEDRPCEP